MKKYYIEFECVSSEKSYSIQSKWFDTKEEAKYWYRTSFDYIDSDDIVVSLMSAEVPADGGYDDIKFEEEITTQYFLRSDI